MWIRSHAHPRMEVMTMQLGGGSISPRDAYNVGKFWGNIATKLPAGEYHWTSYVDKIDPKFMRSRDTLGVIKLRWYKLS